MSAVSKQIQTMCAVLGDTMTEEQAQKAMDYLREHGSIADMESLYYSDDVAMTPLYSLLSETNAEMGGFARY